VWTIDADTIAFTAFPGVTEETFMPHYEKARTGFKRALNDDGEQFPERKKSYLAAILDRLKRV
jgi:hypothetical protein